MNHSRQRDVILDYLKGTSSHPTAEEVYENIRVLEPNISLGTVYRNLKQLADNGMIQRLHMNDGIDHFDADTSSHHHLFCTNCCRVYDLEQAGVNSFSRNVNFAELEGGNKIEGFVIYFYGKCRNCISSEQEKNA